jgi:hypothetical protein
VLEDEDAEDEAEADELGGLDSGAAFFSASCDFLRASDG